jgi:hypothetical protein
VYYDGQDSSNYTLSGSAVTAVSDLSTNNRDCTASGVTIDSTWNAFRFDGSTSEIKVEDFTISGGDFVHTTSLWLYKDEETSQKIFYFGADVLSGSPSNDSISALNTDGSGYLQWYHWGNDTAFNVKLYPNNWYHVVLVYPGGTTNNKTVYVNGQSISPLNSGSGNPINLPTTIDLFLGRGRSASPGRMKGMIANFRIQNRALSADEIWQLYAYQKEYFDVSPDVVTFKGGRLGIGTSEPRAVLDVRGDIYGGCPVFFSASRSNVIDGAQDVIYNQVHYNKGGGYSGTTGKFTAPLSGYYKFNWHDLTRNSANSTSIRPYINNNTVTLPNSTGADRYGVYDQSSDANYRNMAGSWIVYLSTGDTFHIRLISGNLNSNYNCFNGFYLSS